MLFSSMTFLWIFLPIVVLGTCLIRKTKYQNIFLLCSSLIFYAWGEPFYVLLMIFSIVINWCFGLLIDRTEKMGAPLLAVCVTVNLSLLGYFKYYNFFVDSINDLFGSTVFENREIALPIGISFFTFQALSYVIDVYRRTCKVQKNLFYLALYVSFFPQLIAGPIVRYHDIDEQIQSREMSAEKFAVGFRRFTYGLGKKVIVSNCCAALVDQIYSMDMADVQSMTAWAAAVLYTLQIYYDFSGYSDMAISLGKMFGFELRENFNYPYLSRSIREFWKRWHISLGSWFREYLYIPLGGNQKGKVRTYLNLVIVFFLTGMWHGASWNFVVWGLYHGFFQIIERLGFDRILEKCRPLSHVYAMFVVIIGWVFFRAETLTQGLQMIQKMLLPWACGGFGFDQMIMLLTTRQILIILCGIIGAGLLQIIGDKCPKLKNKWKFSSLEAVCCMAILAYSIVLLISGTYNPFIYFRF